MLRFSLAVLLLGMPGLLSGGTYLGTVSIQPQFPTTSDTITAVVTGTLPDPCHPSPSVSVTFSGQNITVNLSSSRPLGGVCVQVISPFTTNVSLGRLAAASYSVTYRLSLDGNVAEEMTQTFAVTAACSYYLSTSGSTFQASGGTGSFGVITPAGCVWAVSGLPGWISGVNPAASNGNATVIYQVAQNVGSTRSATLSVAGVPYTITQTGGFTGLNVVGSMAQIASGQQWTTAITLINKGTTPASTRVSFFDDNGNPLTLSLMLPQDSQTPGPLTASAIDRTVNPGAALLIQCIGGGAATQVGWAQVLADGDVDGFATFSTQQGTAVVPLDVRNSNSYLLYFDNTNGYSTGVALANSTTQTVAVNLTMRDDTGTAIGTDTITIPGMSHTSFNMLDRSPGTAQKRGTIEIGTSPTGRIVALGLRFGPAGTFSTIPVLTK